MEESFKLYLEEIMKKRINNAHVYLQKQNKQYSLKYNRKMEIRNMLKEVIENREVNSSSVYWKLVQEYLKLDVDTYYVEHVATYVQAISDFIDLLENSDR